MTAAAPTTLDISRGSFVCVYGRDGISLTIATRQLLRHLTPDSLTLVSPSSTREPLEYGEFNQIISCSPDIHTSDEITATIDAATGQDTLVIDSAMSLIRRTNPLIPDLPSTICNAQTRGVTILLNTILPGASHFPTADIVVLVGRASRIGYHAAFPWITEPKLTDLTRRQGLIAHRGLVPEPFTIAVQ